MNRLPVSLLLSMIFCSGFLQAQKFLHAKIKLNDSTELNGYVQDQTDLQMNVMISFRKTLTDPVQEIDPRLTQDITFENGRWFSRETVSIAGQKDSISLLLKNIIQGRLKVYYLKQKGKEFYFLQKDAFRVTQLRKTNRIALLNFYFKDCTSPTLKLNLKNANSQRRLLLSIKEYNKCLPGKSETTYYKPTEEYLTLGFGPLISNSAGYGKGFRLSVFKGFHSPDKSKYVSYEHGLTIFSIGNNEADGLELYPVIPKFHTQLGNSSFYLKASMGLALGVNSNQRFGIGLAAISAAGVQFRIFKKNYVQLEYSPTFLIPSPAPSFNIAYTIYNKSKRGKFGY